MRQPEVTMTGAPDKTVILHWQEPQTAWAVLSWRDWVRFRGLLPGEHTLLAGAEAGEHFFLVCILGDDGELDHAIPHRYMMSAEGRLVHGIDGLAADEREESSRIGELEFPTAQEIERYNELGVRALSANLPPPRTVAPLLRAMPGLAAAADDADCWQFLAAVGVCRPGGRPN
jgi:hypothetical protein